MNRLTTWFVAIMAVAVLNSCLDSNKTTTEISDKAVITQFTLKGNETVESYSFTIDSDSMVIYNSDSITCGTSLDSLYAIITPTFYKVWVNDTIDLYMFDTLWMNFENPVTYTVVASDKKTEATYTLKVNRHTVDPDTMVWSGVTTEVFAGVSQSERAFHIGEKLLYMAQIDNTIIVRSSENGSIWDDVAVSGLPASVTEADMEHLVSTGTKVYLEIDNQVYSSENGTQWSKMDITGTIDRLLFFMNDNLYAVAVNSDSQQLLRLDNNTWTTISTLPTSFPTTGEAVTVAPSPTGTYRVFVVGGINAQGNYLNSVWSTENGTYWSDLTSGTNQFTPRTAAAIAQYADHIMLFGGHDAEGKIIKTEMWSKDYGMTWQSMDSTKKALPQLYVRRYGLSAVATPDGYLFLIGGRASADTQIADVWRGLHYASLPYFKD